jgi:hypothetical protein
LLTVRADVALSQFAQMRQRKASTRRDAAARVLAAGGFSACSAQRDHAEFALHPAKELKRAVESTEDFKARIAAIISDKPEQVTGTRRPHPMLVRTKRVIRTQKRRRR